MPSSLLVSTEEGDPVKEGSDNIRVVKTEVWEVSQTSLLEQRAIIEADILEKQQELTKIDGYLALLM